MKEDARFFFGRRRDTELIVDNLVAYRLTLLYGASGAGKSSVLGAGVAPALRKLGDHGLDGPSALVVTLNSWRDNPSERIDEAIEAAASVATHERMVRPDRDWPLARRLSHWSAQLGVELYFILDQFEEYFLYHENPKEPFGIELCESVTAGDDLAHFLLAIREDAMAKLDRFEGRIPNLFDNLYRLEHLHRDQAHEAITGPIDEFNRRTTEADPMAIEPDLVDQVIEDVLLGKVVIGIAGEGRVTGAVRDEIETAHLQLVMERLWSEERAIGSRMLHAATFDALGGAKAIVQSYLATTMNRLSKADRRLAARVFKQLVTPSGTKIAHRLDDLSVEAGVTTAELGPVLEGLSSGDCQVLLSIPPPTDRPDALRYEIYHDALAGAVLEWRQGQERAQQEADARAAIKRERRRLVLLSTVSVVLAGLLATSVLLAAQTRRTGQRRNSEKLASRALAEVGSDPTRAVHTALEAWDASHTALAEDALRRVGPSVLQVERALSGHTGGVTSAEFSPDGHTVLTTSKDGTARLWDRKGGYVTLAERKGSVTFGRFSHDGRSVLIAGEDFATFVSGASTGREIARLNGFQPMDAVFSPDDRTVVTADFEGTRMWDAHTGKLRGTLGNPTSSITALAFTPDGKQVVTGDVSGDVRVWSTDTAAELAVMKQPANASHWGITRIAVSPDGQNVAAGDTGANVYLWRRAQPDIEPTNLGASLPSWDVRAMEFSRDGSRLAAAAEKSTFVWQISAPPAELDVQPKRLDGPSDFATSVVFSPNGEFVVTGSEDGTAFVHDAATGRLMTELRGHRGAVTDVDVSTDNHILTASTDGTARQWLLSTQRLFRHDDWVLDAKPTQDGSRLVSAGADGAIEVWDMKSGRVLNRIEGTKDEPYGPLNTVDVDRTGRYVAAGDTVGIVRVWDLATGGQPGLVAQADLPEGGSIVEVAFNPTGQTLAIGTSNGPYLWRWQSTDNPAKLDRAKSFGETSIAWSPKGDRFATGDSDGSVRIWSAQRKVSLHTLVGHQDQVRDLSFSPLGDRLVTASSDRTARIWDTGTGLEKRELRGHELRLSSVSFDQTGTRVVTGAADGTVGVWDADSGRNLSLTRTHGDSVNSVEFLANGSILSAGDDNLVRLYSCSACTSADSLVRTLRARLRRIPDPATRKSSR